MSIKLVLSALVNFYSWQPCGGAICTFCGVLVHPRNLFHLRSKLYLIKKLLTHWHSWVMLDDSHNFVPLPREKILFTSPPRTTLSLETPNSYPGKEPLAISCSSGTAYLTNQRVSPKYPKLRFNGTDMTGNDSWFICLWTQISSSNPSPPQSSICKIPMSRLLSSGQTCGLAFSSL